MNSGRQPSLPRRDRVVVVGAGVGGLVAALELAHRGAEVTLVERAAEPGGKMRRVGVAGQWLDAGPTVFTMRWVFDGLCDDLGLRLDDHLALKPLSVLARHAWNGDAHFDLHADVSRAADAIGDFAGADAARGYRDFVRRGRDIYRTLEGPFLRSSRPTPVSLAWRCGLAGLPGLLRISPFARLWRELGRHFADPRLRQLFGRYATYCGASPFHAPATLMLVAHVEREAVWRVEGGMARLAQVLARCAQQQGVRLRCGSEVSRLLVSDGRISGVQLADGETLPADAVVFNGDARALTTGLLGPDAPRDLAHGRPSLSALTWHAEAETSGFELSHHNVFFGPAAGYRAEFDAMAAGRLPSSPTVYLCAQDRSGQARQAARPGPRRAERLMLLVNAPADAHGHGLSPEEIARCEAQMLDQLRRCGLRLNLTAPPLRTTPQDFAQRFPASQGALYGPASQGWRASFQARPAGRTTLPGLFLAGGSVHPGPGVPMAALSGQLAAEQLLAGLASTSASRLVAMPGGMSTR